jgi:type I restriction enzyme S subunit
MATEWTEKTLGDFVNLQRGHDLIDADRRAGRIPVMGSAGQNGFHDTAKAKGPGIVIGRSGASFGKVHYSEADYWPHNTALYVTDFKGNDPRFAFYFLGSINFDRFNSGSAQPSLNRNFIYPIPVRVPPLREQKAIARILGTLDDKIELNRRMNATLEAMARALFQSWFVDFDPVHAKAAGHPPSMDAATAALFPATLRDSNRGKIPSGWSYLEAQEVAQIGIGKTPPRKEPQWFSESPSDIPWVSIRDMGASGVFAQQTSEFLTEDAVTRFSVRRVPKNSVLLSFKLTVGRVVIADMPLTTNEAIAHFGLNADQGITHEFLYLYLSQFDYDSLGSTSSIATAVNSATIRMMPILVPPRELISGFTEIVSPLFERIRINQSESVTLGATRDVLLPRLLNGEIDPLRAD